MKKKKLYILIFYLSLAGYGWLAWNIVEESGQHSIPTVCIFKGITGLPCPSCGTTHSLMLLARGKFLDSFLVNPFGAVLACSLVIFPLWITADLIRKKDGFFRFYNAVECTLSKNSRISLAAISFVVINWVWNIIKGF